MDWSQFDNMIDTEMMDKLKELDEGVKKVPVGKYEVVCEKMELAMSKKQNPMTVMWFRIVQGEYKKSIVFTNYVMKSAYGIHNVKEFLRGMKPGNDVKFESFAQWDKLLGAIANEFLCKNSFVLEIGEQPNKNNPDEPYKTYKIIGGPYPVPSDYKAPEMKVEPTYRVQAEY